MTCHQIRMTLALVLCLGFLLEVVHAEPNGGAKAAPVDLNEIEPLRSKPLYEFTEAEVDRYLRYLQTNEPDLRKRIIHLARKNLGQPYELYLLGEMPFEPYDPQPIYCLSKSDCLVYSEHTYAMALSRDWPGFMALLQRIRYRDGRLGVVTRNHFTEADWNVSNRWLVEDITTQLAGDRVVVYQQKVDRARFFRNRYQLEVDIPVESHRDTFLPVEHVDLAKPHLADGDFVNIVRGYPGSQAGKNEIFGGSAWVGHVGLVVHGQDGVVNMIHSTKPQVREEPLDDYIARSLENADDAENAKKPRLLGFKFFRLRDDPLANLQKIDGPDAPVVTLPKG
ncbi:MAG: N-acetylmuramoyl-L-alanine amidase-like domain-containing protein, partial [Aeoliella sp.]